MKKTLFSNLVYLLLMLTFYACKSNADEGKSQSKEDIISVEYPEVYELANIVLALTEYGINDQWQVRKDFPYYDEMRAYFEPYMDHPLLDSVNCSREKWQEYLSYRTDSYVFDLDDNYHLNRKNDFQSFEIKTFDQYKELTEDFARQSNFKNFYREKKSYYDQIVAGYQKEYYLKEMKQFLTNEFGDYFTNKRYSVVISPFVYAQNLHRDIDSSWTADFPTVAKAIIEGSGFENEEDKSTEIHTLFTEMDHGFVNPVSSEFDVAANFNEKRWDDDSGYAGYGDAVFNEYMTWAVFDIFNNQYFPEIAQKVNLNWHFQNDTRGFPFSNYFATELKNRYQQHKGKKTIKELYPEMLAWSKAVQADLSKPSLLNDSDTLQVDPSRNLIPLQFSEKMVKVDSFDVVLQFSQWDKEVVTITKANNLQWDESGTSLSFEIKLPHKNQYYLLCNWWGVQTPLMSEKGISLKATSGFIIQGS